MGYSFNTKAELPSGKEIAFGRSGVSSVCFNASEEGASIGAEVVIGKRCLLGAEGDLKNDID